MGETRIVFGGWSESDNRYTFLEGGKPRWAVTTNVYGGFFFNDLDSGRTFATIAEEGIVFSEPARIEHKPVNEWSGIVNDGYGPILP